MSEPLFVAMTGLDAQHTRMSVIANNLANVNTVGYKRDRTVFADLLYQNIEQVGADSTQDTTLPSGVNLGTGVRLVATEKLHSQGNVVHTENALDVAIQGRGFMQVLMPDGSLGYTRNGALQRDASGQLVTARGYLIQPSITIPDGAQNITIASDGVVSVQLAGQTQPTQVGSIQLADFINPTGLQAMGDNLFIESAASGSPQTGNPGDNGLGVLVQGSLETSNVNVVSELVSMIETQRAYEMNSKAIETSDEMLQYVLNQL
jgi:flagellar basal-body rod protein FlgG